MNIKYKHLFEPIQLNQMILKNRIFASSGVHAGDVHHGVEVSKGGASMLCTCMSDVACEKSYFYPDSRYSFGKEMREKKKTNIRRVHQGGAKYVLEMTHVGEYYRAIEGDFAWGTQDKINELGIQVKGLDKKNMEIIANAYANTAMDALELGFDALLFDCSAGWLLSQFLSPHYNGRMDEYGGSIENRARFPIQVIQKMREKVGPNVPIFCQVCVHEYFEDGLAFADVIAFLKMIEPYIDCVFAICGNDQNHIQMTKLVATNLEPHLMNAEYTQVLKKELNIPIALLGSVMSPEEAESVLVEGKADLVGLSRPLIADPSMVSKLIQNKEEDIVPCIRCNQCFHVASDYKYVGCSVNPAYTQEEASYVTSISTCSQRRKVVVIGGGPAGLRAALSADQCGHQVILIEKEKEIGGMLRYIAKEEYKEDIARYYMYLQTQIKKSNIKVMVDTEASNALVKELQPDKVIIAIGAMDCIPPIEGIKNKQVLSATQAIMHPELIKKKVVVIGGGTIGIELALGMCHDEERSITVIELSDTIATSANILYQLALKERLKTSPRISIQCATQCKKIEDNNVYVHSNHGEERFAADTIILATGMQAKTKEAFALFGICEDTVMIGDVVQPRGIMDATYEGYSSGVNIL